MQKNIYRTNVLKLEKGIFYFLFFSYPWLASSTVDISVDRF